MQLYQKCVCASHVMLFVACRHLLLMEITYLDSLFNCCSAAVLKHWILGIYLQVYELLVRELQQLDGLTDFCSYWFLACKIVSSLYSTA